MLRYKFILLTDLQHWHDLKGCSKIICFRWISRKFLKWKCTSDCLNITEYLFMHIFFTEYTLFMPGCDAKLNFALRFYWKMSKSRVYFASKRPETINQSRKKVFCLLPHYCHCMAPQRDTNLTVMKTRGNVTSDTLHHWAGIIFQTSAERVKLFFFY